MKATYEHRTIPRTQPQEATFIVKAPAGHEITISVTGWHDIVEALEALELIAHPDSLCEIATGLIKHLEAKANAQR